MLSLSFPRLQKSLSFPPSDPSSPARRRAGLWISAVAKASQPPNAATMYELLSVSQTAGPEEIKAAYRRQARLWHPDLCQTAGDKSYFAEQFKRAHVAYEVLSDPDLRQNYDQAIRTGADVSPGAWASAAVSGGGGGGRGGDGAREKAGFRENWASQMEGLGRRADQSGRGETWGSRMRRRRRSTPSD